MIYLKIILIVSLLVLLYKINECAFNEDFNETFNDTVKSINMFKNIGIKAGTDKIHHHGYDRFYPLFLNNIKNTSNGILEIGIDQTYSLKLWLEYFPNAFIYGLDIGVEMKNDRVHVFKADQSKLNDLINVKMQITRPIDFIIDDGSHIPDHQILTFNYFFRHLLQPGGIYIVEDIEASYWTKNSLYGYPTNYGYKNPNSFIEHTKSLVDTINDEFLDDNSRQNNKLHLGLLSKETTDMISSMTFGYNCVIFVKKTLDDMKYLNRPYKHAANL